MIRNTINTSSIQSDWGFISEKDLLGETMSNNSDRLDPALTPAQMAARVERLQQKLTQTQDPQKAENMQWALEEQERQVLQRIDTFNPLQRKNLYVELSADTNEQSSAYRIKCAILRKMQDDPTWYSSLKEDLALKGKPFNLVVLQYDPICNRFSSVPSAYDKGVNYTVVVDGWKGGKDFPKMPPVLERAQRVFISGGPVQRVTFSNKLPDLRSVTVNGTEVTFTRK